MNLQEESFKPEELLSPFFTGHIIGYTCTIQYKCSFINPVLMMIIMYRSKCHWGSQWGFREVVWFSNEIVINAVIDLIIFRDVSNIPFYLNTANNVFNYDLCNIHLKVLSHVLPKTCRIHGRAVVLNSIVVLSIITAVPNNVATECKSCQSYYQYTLHSFTEDSQL